MSSWTPFQSCLRTTKCSGLTAYLCFHRLWLGAYFNKAVETHGRLCHPKFEAFPSSFLQKILFLVFLLMYYLQYGSRLKVLVELVICWKSLITVSDFTGNLHSQFKSIQAWCCFRAFELKYSVLESRYSSRNYTAFKLVSDIYSKSQSQIWYWSKNISN